MIDFSFCCWRGFELIFCFFGHRPIVGVFMSNKHEICCFFVGKDAEWLPELLKGFKKCLTVRKMDFPVSSMQIAKVMAVKKLQKDAVRSGSFFEGNCGGVDYVKYKSV